MVTGNHASNHLTRDMALLQYAGHFRKRVGPLPHNLALVRAPGLEVFHHANPTQYSLMDDGDPVAKRLGVGENMGREKNCPSLLLKAEDQFADLAPAHWIQAG